MKTLNRIPRSELVDEVRRLRQEVSVLRANLIQAEWRMLVTERLLKERLNITDADIAQAFKSLMAEGEATRKKEAEAKRQSAPVLDDAELCSSMSSESL